MKSKFSIQFRITRILFMLSLILLVTACSKDDGPISNNAQNGGETTNITSTANIHFFDTGKEVYFEGLNHADVDRDYGADITYTADGSIMRLKFEDEEKDISLAWILMEYNGNGFSERGYQVGASNNRTILVDAQLYANNLAYMAGLPDVEDDGQDLSGTGSIQFTSITDTHVTGTYSFTAYVRLGRDSGAKVEVINGEFECKILRN